MQKPGLFIIIIGAFAGAACGGNDAKPTLITGGGVGSGGIDGLVNVYVVDETTAVPISGAKVRVGTMDGTTDATGLFVAKSDSLSGKQNVTAVATGHVPTMWVGVDGANVTIPVEVSGAGTPTVPQAEIDGTIDGWDGYQPQNQQDALVGIVSYSQTTDFGAAENSIAQPPGPLPAFAQITGNMCVKATFGSPACAPKVNSRTGRVALVATIADVNFNGTATGDDDVYTVLGYAAKTGITVDNGVKQTGVELTAIAAGDTVTGGIDFGTPPAALTVVQGLIGLDLGLDGVAFIPDPLKPSAHTALIPTPSAFSGLTYRVVATASASKTNTDTQSLVLKHGLADASNIAVGEWLTTPTGLTASGDVMSFTAVTGAKLHGFEIHGADGSKAWSVTIFDGSVSATVPADLAPIPTGSDALKVSAIDADIDVSDFNLADKLDLVNRLSSDSVTFTK